MSRLSKKIVQSFLNLGIKFSVFLVIIGLSKKFYHIPIFSNSRFFLLLMIQW